VHEFLAESTEHYEYALHLCNLEKYTLNISNACTGQTLDPNSQDNSKGNVKTRQSGDT